MSVHTRSEHLAPVFHALADETRLELISRLTSEEPMSISRLADGLEITHQGVTKHLRVLEEAGLVRYRRKGREKQYIGNPQGLRIANTYIEQVSKRWDSALARLKNFVED